MREIAQNSQMRAIALAVIGAVMAAAATMFVPAAILEGITGSTGLSELVPATAAPLGDTARALIAFGTGALVLAILAIFLSRSDRTEPSQPKAAAPVSDAIQTRPTLLDRLPKISLPALALPKMPWVKGDDDITDFADLPKLRGGDAHPDAPPRRPLIATQDLPELDLAAIGTQLPSEADDPVYAPVMVDEPQFAPSAPEPVVVAEEYVPPAAPVLPTAAPVFEPAQAQSVNHEPTLAEMVAQLEAAVAQRQQQLVALEATATAFVQPTAQSVPEAVAEVEAPAEVEAAVTVESEVMPPEPYRFERPALEAVPASPATQDDMDAALTAALETLQRMNATAR